MRIFISSELENLEMYSKISRHETLRKRLELLGVKPMPVLGCYQRVYERSYMVETESMGILFEILRIAKGFGQDSILIVDADNGSYLMFPDGRDPMGIGVFREVSHETAQAAGAWSLIGDRYYLAS